MLYSVSMMSGVDHDRVEGLESEIVARMTEMLEISAEDVSALLVEASRLGKNEFQGASVRAWILTLHS